MSEVSVSIATVLQAVTTAALIAGSRMLWVMGREIASINSMLSDPELGVKATIVSLRKSRHNDSNTLQSHEIRLDGHDKDLERIDAVLIREPHGDRHINTATGEPYDRRTK